MTEQARFEHVADAYDTRRPPGVRADEVCWTWRVPLETYADMVRF